MHTSTYECPNLPVTLKAQILQKIYIL